MCEENDIHQCEVLELNGRYLEYAFKDSGRERWYLVHAIRGQVPDERDQIIMNHVLFCPGCGLDLRASTGSDYPGKPHMSKVLAKAGCLL